MVTYSMEVNIHCFDGLWDYFVSDSTICLGIIWIGVSGCRSVTLVLLVLCLYRVPPALPLRWMTLFAWWFALCYGQQHCWGEMWYLLTRRSALQLCFMILAWLNMMHWCALLIPYCLLGTLKWPHCVLLQSQELFHDLLHLYCGFVCSIAMALKAVSIMISLA